MSKQEALLFYWSMPMSLNTTADERPADCYLGQDDCDQRTRATQEPHIRFHHAIGVDWAGMPECVATPKRRHGHDLVSTFVDAARRCRERWR